MKNRQEFPGTSAFTDVRGKRRWRYRKGDFTVSLGTDYGSPEFVRKYEAALKGERLSKGEAALSVSQAPPGSLSNVIAGWYTSPQFKALTGSTQSTYRGEAERLRNDHGNKRVKGLTAKIIKKMMAKKADTPAAANNLLRILHLVLDYAVDEDIIDVNPSRGIKKYKVHGDGFHTWEETEIEAYFKAHALGTTADLAMTLMLYTGAARGDAVELGPKNITFKEGRPRLKYSRKKMRNRGGVPVDVPVHPILWARLEPLMDQETFLQTQARKPRSPNGLGNVMRKWCDSAKLPECTAHGLRKACGRRLADAGATPHEIMAALGHKTLAEAQRYTEKYDRVQAADRGWEKQAASTEN